MTAVTTSKRGYFGKGSVVVDSEGEGAVRRLAITADKLVEQPFDGINVIPDVLARTAREYGNRHAMGWRNVVKIHEEEKGVKKTVGGKEVVEIKKWKYFELSNFEYISYLEVRERVLELARGLLHHGLSKSDVFNVYSQTSVNWQLMSHACTTISTPVATAYDTLGEAGLAHSLNEPNCAGIFTNAELLPVLARVIKETPSVRLVVYDGEVKQTLLDQIRSAREGITVISVDELRETGRAQPLDVLESHKPTPEDLALIMYTSGSTGAPKGVMLTHGNVVASLGGIYYLIGHHLLPDDTLLAYLPLAHTSEYMVELTFFAFGVKTGYGRVKTLTDASVRNCKGDIAAFRPSILIGVPQVWETICKNILARMKARGSLKKNMFNSAMALKRASVPMLTDIADSVVLSRVRAAMGGRLRLAMSGGVPLSKETQEHLSVALVMMLQGYWMTESCAVCAILPPELMKYGSVGLPVSCIEVKLIDVPEAGYRAAGIPCQGEVCIRGPAVTRGYYKRPDLNEDETIFTKDGWLRTGDVGQWHADGTLSLIDRIKNLVKLQGGEYVALERLEATYKACSLVSNICVHASAEAEQPIGIVIPHEVNLRHALAQRSLPGVDCATSLVDLCHNEVVQALVMKECNVMGKKSEFKSMEMLDAVILTADEWTPENGLVTAAQKVQRSKVTKHFEREIKTIYSKCSWSWMDHATAPTHNSYGRQRAVQEPPRQPHRAQEESSSDKIVRLEKANQQQLRNELSNSQRQRERQDKQLRSQERTHVEIAQLKEANAKLRGELTNSRRAADEQMQRQSELLRSQETRASAEIAQLKQANQELRDELADSRRAADERMERQGKLLRSQVAKANDKIVKLKQANQELQLVIRAHEPMRQCEALLDQGRTLDAAELLLEMEISMHEHIEASQFLTKWLTDITAKYVRILEKAGDEASSANKLEEAIAPYAVALSLGTSAPDLLTKWVRATLTGRPAHEAFGGARKFKVPIFDVYRAIGTILEEDGRITEAVEILHKIQTSLLDDADDIDERAQWERAFRKRCVEKLVMLGDTAREANEHDKAIKYYSDALSLRPIHLNEILLRRSIALIELDPSSHIGYEQQHAALHGLGRYTEAFRASQLMLSKLEQSPEPKIRRIRHQYIDVTSKIQHEIDRAIRDLPTVLIDTDTSRLYNKAQQAGAFKELPVYDELRASMIKVPDYPRIRREVGEFYRYVMFSHKWQLEEPTFQQVENTSVYKLPLSPIFEKLRRFLELVVSLRFKWAWSDTCCVNQHDKGVQQESIVAMFKWYRHSSLTIVHLLGVLSESQEPGCLWRSIWNTRGWTYQEYVASHVIQFYTEDWKPYLELHIFNHKESTVVLSEMEQATNVTMQELSTLQPGLGRAREKLYLASRRRTTREEDMAYSLFGIFNVALPVIYGEGNLAVGRLLEHILTRSADVTLLAWTGHSGSQHTYLPADLTVYNQITPPHVPPPIETTEMNNMVSSVRSSLPDMPLATALYQHLHDLSPLSLVAGRLRLPGFVFPLFGLALSESESDPDLRVYRATTPMLGHVEIKTTDDLSGAEGLLLVHPWISPLLDRDFAVGVPQFDLPARALRLAVRLRQSFGALMLAPSARAQYTRVAADSLIMARVREETSLQDLMDVIRTVDVQ